MLGTSLAPEVTDSGIRRAYTNPKRGPDLFRDNSPLDSCFPFGGHVYYKMATGQEIRSGLFTGICHRDHFLLFVRTECLWKFQRI